MTEDTVTEISDNFCDAEQKKSPYVFHLGTQKLHRMQSAADVAPSKPEWFAYTAPCSSNYSDVVQRLHVGQVLPMLAVPNEQPTQCINRQTQWMISEWLGESQSWQYSAGRVEGCQQQRFTV